MAEYQALYRKYRPKDFKSVIGQKHIVRTLMNQLKSGRISHAYLFCGTRGTGKTSIAKIFAKAINCAKSSESGEPCNECELCKAVNEGRSVNVIEIDAASNNGVDKIRELIDELRYTPTEGIYKVYIIDEVHMLSPGAFNALLKSLEEPPEHVVFILATTDPQKIPITILSRCQRFDFKRIAVKDIAEALKTYAKNESIDIDTEALYLIARFADGSMRDSLSLLDQCWSVYYGEHISREKVLEVAGSVDNSVFERITDNIVNKNAQALLNEIDEMMINGRDAGQFVSNYIGHLRNLFIASAIPNSAEMLGISNESAAELSVQVKRISREEIAYLINVFSRLESDIKYSSNKRVLLEICLIKLCAPVTENGYDAIAAKLSKIEREIASGEFVKAAANDSKAIKKEKPKVKIHKATTEDYKKAIEVWNDILSSLENPEAVFLKNAMLKQLDTEKIYVVCEDDNKRDNMAMRKAMLDKAFTERLGVELELEIITKNDYDRKHESIYGVTEDEAEAYEKENEGMNEVMAAFPGMEIED